MPALDAPQRVFIYSVPGSGKTTIGRALATRLAYRFVEADCVRDYARRRSSHAHRDPFLALGTTEAWRQFGELIQSTAVNGLMAVRDALAPFVVEEIEQQRVPFVFEAAFLRPSDVRHVGPMLLVATEDEQTHEKRFFEHRARDQSSTDAFRAARILQAYLMQEGRQAGIGILSNCVPVEETAARAAQLIHD